MQTPRRIRIRRRGRWSAICSTRIARSATHHRVRAFTHFGDTWLLPNAGSTGAPLRDRSTCSMQSIRHLRANRLLETLSARLLVEGERVVRSNERMAATLRRALETAETGENRRLLGLIREFNSLHSVRVARCVRSKSSSPSPPALSHSTHSVGLLGPRHTRPGFR